MTNFEFLNDVKGFEQLKQYCDNAESFVLSNLDISAICARNALEFVVKTVYVSRGAYLPENASLFELIDGFEFSGFVNNEELLSSLHYVRKVGNRGAHGEKIKQKEAVLCLKNLHFFVAEILVKLGTIKGYNPFDEKLLLKTEEKPKLQIQEKVVLSEEYQKFVGNKIESSQSLNISKNPMFMSEAETRKLYIDEDLKLAGWEVLSQENVANPCKAGIEIEVAGMPNSQNKGYVDYVLFGKNNKPLAIVEAKKTSVDAIKGEHQAELYAECLERQYGYKPVIYYTNGYEIKMIDGLGYPARKVFGFHTINELELILQHRNRDKITDLKINDNITNRPYQKTAITKVCEYFNHMHRRALLVMATGTGKTRVAISLVDVLKRNNWVKNVLFLADRTSLVKQAFKNFSKLLPDETICELSDKSTKRDFNARIMFSTYQTMINFIDKDVKDFSVGRFDLIIIDEAHRSVFNKYGAIFEYFDCLLVGLTATPRSDVDRSTYQLFEMEEGVPNFHYELDEAVKDGYLVNYTEFDRTSAVLKRGIKYSQLSEEDKKQIEMSYEVEENTPVDVAPSDIFRIIYNQNTVDKVLQDLMENGLKVNNGEKIGKSIIFAYNHKHAEYIVDRFRALYPEYPDDCRLIDNYVTYAQSLIDNFEIRDKLPQIAVSVDMLDTGIDVPDILNLVFFKPVKSKIKFLQMIGRGTRLSENIFGPGRNKEKFYIFDYCDNFEFFEQNPNAETLSSTKSVTEKLFNIKTDLVFELQALEYQENKAYKELYLKLRTELYNSVKSLNRNRILVHNNLQFVDKYCLESSWNYLSKLDVQEIKNHISKLIVPSKEDDRAKLFDVKLYIIELSTLNDMVNASKQIQDVIMISNVLSKMTNIPQIKAQIDVIKQTMTQTFWQNINMTGLEKVRVSLRNLMKFLEDGLQITRSFINVPDEITIGSVREGVNVAKIKTYEEKVLDYLAEHTNSVVISKIKNLEQLNKNDVKELEKLLWVELGTKQEYFECTDKQNLAIFIRSLTGLNQDAINRKFSKFIDDYKLNSKQQELVKAVIDFIRENGSMEPQDLMSNSPFNDVELAEIFGEKIKVLVEIINQMNKVVSVA